MFFYKAIKFFYSFADLMYHEMSHRFNKNKLKQHLEI